MDIKESRLYVKLKYLYYELKFRIKYQFGKHCLKFDFEDEKNIFIFLSCDYGNVGDIAISYAQRKFLEDNYKEYKIIEIPLSYTFNEMKYIKKNIGEYDIITLIGGGNMSNRFEYFELVRRYICKVFKTQKIISFPQTVDFDNTNSGKISMTNSIKIYNELENLTIAARENESYMFFKKHITKNNVILTPDIVLYLKDKIDIRKSNKRVGLGLCLRNDKEKNLNNDKILKVILKEIEEEKIFKFDTHIGDEKITYENKDSFLFEMLENISKRKLIITDRLHCMIFCYLTNTPCIALDNSNHKIKNVYSAWLQDCKYIKLSENKFEKNLLKNLETCKDFKSKNLNSYFDCLIDKER